MSYEAENRESYLRYGESYDATFDRPEEVARRKKDAVYPEAMRYMHLWERMTYKPCRGGECDSDCDGTDYCERHEQNDTVIRRWLRRYASTR